MFYGLLSFISIGLLGLGIYILIDDIITRKRVTINQQEWEEYSRGMDCFEKAEKYLQWCEENMIKHEWLHKYYPRLHWEQNDVAIYASYKTPKPGNEGIERS